MQRIKILVIDDEQLIRWSFDRRLKSAGYLVFTAETGEEGIRIFEDNYPDIVFVDNKLPGIQGIDVIRKIKSLQDDTHIVFMTAYGSIETAVKAMKFGASDYINKPFDFNEIMAIIANISENIRLSNEVMLLKRQHSDKITFDHIVGQSPVMMKTIHMAHKIAAIETTTVLLLGESGTGKDYLARAIHHASSRGDQPFVVINCSSFAETILESELFGHEQGAFTDAKKSKKGLFEMADGGTVFLDEIGEINTATQVKLLGVIENRTIRRVGGTADIPIDIRIIAATNKNLESSVREKSFREDLYYRLKVFQLNMPALKDHKEDIPELVQHFIEQFNRQFRKTITGINPEALLLLRKYDWPGNIRELKNVIERAVILESDTVITTESLPLEIAGMDILRPVTNPEPPDNLAGISLYDLEQKTIETALRKSGNNQTLAARMLGITRDTLRYKIKKYKLGR